MLLLWVYESGIHREKLTFTMDLQGHAMGDKFIYNFNYDKQNYPFCRLKLLVENYGYF